jgi:hypothetical protein
VPAGHADRPAAASGGSDQGDDPAMHARTRSVAPGKTGRCVVAEAATASTGAVGHESVGCRSVACRAQFPRGGPCALRAVQRVTRRSASGRPTSGGVGRKVRCAQEWAGSLLRGARWGWYENEHGRVRHPARPRYRSPTMGCRSP